MMIGETYWRAILTFGFATSFKADVLYAPVGTNTSDFPATRLSLDLHGLRKFPLHGQLPLVEALALMNTPPREPSPLAIFGG